MFTSTSATDTADFYEGLHPSLKLVGPVPHVVWHGWDAPSLSRLAELEPLDQLSSEYLVDDRHPYRVSYATYRPGTDAGNLQQAQSSWVSETLQIVESDRILASPKLALGSLDGGKTYQLHVALHQRREYVLDDNSFAWDVWYTNNDSFDYSYIPFFFFIHP